MRCLSISQWPEPEIISPCLVAIDDFCGAEFTRVYANHYGRKLEPDENAMWASRTTRRRVKLQAARQAGRHGKPSGLTGSSLTGGLSQRKSPSNPARSELNPAEYRPASLVQRRVEGPTPFLGERHILEHLLPSPNVALNLS